MSASAIERAVQLACIMSDAERDRALADPRVIAAREVADRCWRDFCDAFLHSDPADRLWLLEQTDRAAVRYATSFVQAVEQRACRRGRRARCCGPYRTSRTRRPRLSASGPDPSIDSR
jgi:hypothetical protein